MHLQRAVIEEGSKAPIFSMQLIYMLRRSFRRQEKLWGRKEEVHKNLKLFNSNELSVKNF
tara:strand:+ start:732 stop:911 length:180 start_codon:yes stop_codon:yes gene_type:complete